jgi:hypothetical protein
VPDSIPGRGWVASLSALSAGVLLSGCINTPVAKQRPQGPAADACLQKVTMDRLDEAIRRCDAVVAAHPRHPQPRNERALLLNLAGRNQLACRDSLAAADLLARAPAKPAPDPLLVEEIKLRSRSCQAWSAANRSGVTTPPATDAPSAATPDAPGR